MAHNELDINTSVSTVPGQTPPPAISFIDSLNYVDQISPTNFQNANALNALLNIFNGSQANLDSYFSNLNQTTLPNDYATFFTTTLSGAPGYTPTSATDLFNAFYTDYETQLSAALPNQEPAWGSLQPPINSTDPNSTTVPPQTYLQEQFSAWFDHFLTTYAFTSSGSVGTSAEFLGSANLELMTTAALNNKSLEPAGSPLATTTLTLPTYQDIYNAYFTVPGDTNPTSPTSPTYQNFIASLNAYYLQQIQANGTFIPSQSFAGWVQDIQANYTQTVGPGILAPPSNDAAADFAQTAILNQIFALIALLINTMQNVASAQANRLTILTQWQTAYTNELQQFHTFLAGDGADGTPGLDQTHMDTLNTDTNTNLRQLVQTYQSTISDDAKSLQSSINQTSDAVSQQSNLATSIIQELSTLLNSIFK